MSIHISTASVGPFEAQKQPVLWERKHKLHEKKKKKKKSNERKANAGADPQCNTHLFVSVCNFTTSDLYHWFNWAMNCSLWLGLSWPIALAAIQRTWTVFWACENVSTSPSMGSGYQQTNSAKWSLCAVWKTNSKHPGSICARKHWVSVSVAAGQTGKNDLR